MARVSWLNQAMDIMNSATTILALLALMLGIRAIVSILNRGDRLWGISLAVAGMLIALAISAGMIAVNVIIQRKMN